MHGISAGEVALERFREILDFAWRTAESRKGEIRARGEGCRAIGQVEHRDDVIAAAMTPQAEKAGSGCKGCDHRAKTYAIGAVGPKCACQG